MASAISVNIGLGNGLSLVKHQAFIWTNAALFSIGPKEYFSEIMIGIKCILPLCTSLRASSI